MGPYPRCAAMQNAAMARVSIAWDLHALRFRSLLRAASVLLCLQPWHGNHRPGYVTLSFPMCARQVKPLSFALLLPGLSLVSSGSCFLADPHELNGLNARHNCGLAPVFPLPLELPPCSVVVCRGKRGPLVPFLYLSCSWLRLPACIVCATYQTIYYDVATLPLFHPIH